MIHANAKCDATIKSAKDERKGMQLTVRSAQHAKKFVNKNDHHSIAANKFCVKEDQNKKKVRNNIFCAG